jgi:hypothetical protein
MDLSNVAMNGSAVLKQMLLIKERGKEPFFGFPFLKG